MSDRSKFDLSGQYRDDPEPDSVPASRTQENDGVTVVEAAAWWIVAVGAAVFVIALFVYLIAANTYLGATSAHVMWLIIGGSIMGLMLPPAILLTGIRELLSRRRA